MDSCVFLNQISTYIVDINDIKLQCEFFQIPLSNKKLLTVVSNLVNVNRWFVGPSRKLQTEEPEH